ncbi:S8 family serine peptidase [Steroidobacter sp. S1-65]|uniref:S8 family serine peptidase n=1 Tax=Steroidobacter gossypii TaxID=2805490 RepID=A0ABS1X4B3_9GAMM|nr:S8 family serine peptidase [Steroidobacter gossypii]MBM0108068.1 S8 family serine peptidase [Steroidobacter gossypii]
MKRHEGLRWLRSGASRLAAPGILGAVALALSPLPVAAKPGAPNLGGGLEQLAQPAAALRTTAVSEVQLAHPVQMDADGRALVRISLDGRTPAEAVLQSLRSTAGVEVMATDMSYRAGVIEAYVPPASLLSIAGKKGVLAVVPSSPMVTNVGLTDSQGVVQHRVDKIPGIDGAGITVGVMSDSYDTNAAPNSAAADVASGDLPGAGNPSGNTEPVVILQDWPNASDEGRAMLQIVHDMAPKARLGFATANGGEVNFANNIRALAGFPDAPNAVPGFKADIIVDDIIYLAEPFFQDGIVAQAVDEVAAAGVSYFSSAGNRPATQSYDSKPRLVPGTAASWSGTNLDFTGVDPALYAGGFHDFNEGSEVDIAQTIAFNSGSTIVFQWNEPYDPVPPTPVGPPIVSGVGTVPPGATSSFTFAGAVGQLVEIFVDADDTTTGVPNPDLVFTLLDPNGAQIQFVDTSTNPESLTLELPIAGTYTVVVDSFAASQFGDYLYRVQEVEVVEQVLSDYNLLFFLPNGTFVGAFAEQNRFSNRPVEIGSLPGATLQMVIARANTPDNRNRNVADRIRYVGFSGVNPQEYFSYLSPVTFGHNSAQGAMSVAAYAFYAPFVPEAFTSPGPSTIYFDKNNKRYRTPQIRQKPDMAAMDGANTTFFSSDSSVDDDTFPNFFGTSAAAPHAAAIAALVLDAAGGPGKVKPDRMRKILQESAFRHDLDPFFSSGFALSGGSLVAINASADQNTISQFDPNVFTLTQIGLRRLASLSINGSQANQTQTPEGIVFDERTTPLPAPGQPFVIGRTVGLSPSDITASFSLPADPPGLPGQWKQLDLAFAPGSFRSGDLLSFGVDRDEADVAGPNGAAGGNSADLLGDGVLIPSGEVVRGGARFFGTYEGGGSFRGEFFNLIGKGYSRLDGYGFVNAEAAVKAVQKKR